MNRLTIEYTPKGRAVSDDRLESEYQIILIRLQCNDVTCRFSNETLFLRVRVGIVEGDIPHNSVRFVWQEQRFTLDKDGRIAHWPPGFLDTTESLLERMI